MKPRSPTHVAALEYAGRGWHVFPLKPGTKFPATTNGHLNATIDAARIDATWTENPAYNVGIAVAPSGLVILDVDVGTNKDGTPKRGRESLAKIEHELSPTLLAETGRGGTHAVYTRPEGVEAHRYIDIGKSIPHVGKESGLDLIGEGYIVAAPSFLTESGRYYSWTQLHAIAPLPPFLQNVTRAPRISEVVEELGTPIAEGGRNNALFRLGCALRDTGISREALARALDAENHQRFNPPVDDFELRTIVDSIMNTVQVKRDVAASAIVAQEIRAIFAPEHKETWLEDVSHIPFPPTVFYSTGFPALDALIGGGFSTQQLNGLIAPPSTGKSALMGHWILRLEQYRPVLHCSLELLKHELFVRYAAHEMKFPWSDGVRGKIPQADMAQAVQGKRIKLMGADDFDRADPLGSLEAAAERMRVECGIAPIIVIDYIQLMARGAAAEMRYKVGELTFRARQMAQKFDTVVIGVFTTQRQMYNSAAVEKMRQAQDPTAYLAAAKESGDIEFDCATLMYLDVDKLHEGPTKPAQIAVARCRQGNVGFVGLRAALDVGSFTEDMDAVAEFASENRAAKREAARDEDIADTLIATIRRLPGRTWGEIQREVSKLTKLRGGPVDKVRDKLVDERVIEKSVRYDDNHRVLKGQTYVILKERNIASPPGVTPPQEEPDHDDSE
jgi:KaiC/GvpD/RAD55 family RecA-like ATPase